MEPLLRHLRALPDRLRALPAASRALLLGVAALVVAIAVVSLALRGAGEDYRYAFTRLGPEDGPEAAAQLQAAGIPFRLEADGTALAVPTERVYDARLLLAAAGLPRGGGVGFELFDRGDLGVSEFTQRVNLRRAIEGELARTIGSLAAVRSARVHIRLPERGLYRDEDRPAAASVVVSLRAGRSLGDREVAGIRHLVAAAVPGLATSEVTVVDGSGTVLGGSAAEGQAIADEQRRIERELEARVVGILEAAVGAGGVVARVTADLDATEVNTRSVVYDPDAAPLRSERRTVSTRTDGATTVGGVAGAAANDPLAPAAVRAGGSGGASSSEDEIRNYEISQTTTETVARAPRIRRLSLAILVDGVDGVPRSDEELARLGALARRAVGFDERRGDEIEIASAIFDAPSRERDAEEAPAADGAPAPLPAWAWGAIAAGALGLLALAARALRRRAAPPAPAPALRPGATVAEIEEESGLASIEAPRPALGDPDAALRERARELASRDPVRAASLLRAWIAADHPPATEERHAGS